MNALTTTVRDLTTDEALKDARHALDRAAVMAEGPDRTAAFAAWAEAWGEPALIALDELQDKAEGLWDFDGDEG